MDYQLAAAGALPALAAMWYVDRLDARRPEPPEALRRAALAGGAAALPSLAVELALRSTGPREGTLAGAAYLGFVVYGLVEELAKALALRWALARTPEFDERLDGLIYGAHAGLGFALVENVLYLLRPMSVSGYLGTFVLRAVLAVPGHAVYSGFVGHLAARRRIERRGPGLWTGLALAVALHGVYDAALFAVPVAHAAWLYAVPALVVLAGFVTLRLLARRAERQDREARPSVAPASLTAPER